ncbi:beta-xylosidase, partial [Alistipes onderdonkii]|nr:beta-xylosidase [Alistipes onderdonkii]
MTCIFHKFFLYLGGRPKEGVKTGTALCLRAESPDYTLETALSDRNAGWSGLTVYGDAANLLVWGLQGDEVLS